MSTISFGSFIALEGIDGAGKTTLSQALIQPVSDITGNETRTIAFPGGVDDPFRAREHTHDPTFTPDPWTAALLFAADMRHALHSHIMPALASGINVITDRWVPSLWVYQGVTQQRLAEVQGLVASLTTQPDVTVWLDLPPQDALARIHERQDERIPSLDDLMYWRYGYHTLHTDTDNDWVKLDARHDTQHLVDAVSQYVRPE